MPRQLPVSSADFPRSRGRRAMPFAGVACCTLLVLLTGCGGGSNDKAPEIAKALILKGAKVSTTESSRMIDEVDKLPPPPYDLGKVDLSELTLARADLEQLQELKKLRILTLYRTNTTDTAVELLLPIKSLLELELSYTRITDVGFTKLGELPHLKKLFVRGTSVTVQAVEEFRKSHPDIEVFH